MQEFWTALGQLEDSQTSIITTLMLICGGGFGVILGSLLFGGRVNDLKSALGASQDIIEAHKEASSKQLQDINVQLSSTLELLSQLRGRVDDIQTEVDEQASKASPAEDANLREDLKFYWYAIRDELWKRASRPKINFKTRALYSRFTNYELPKLIELMLERKHLEEHEARYLKAAVELWNWHRNGRPELTEAEVEQMKHYAEHLIAGLPSR